MSTSNPLLHLAQAAAEWHQRPIDNMTDWATRRAILDWFATTLPGCILPPATLLVSACAAQANQGNAICYVDGSRASARNAALINATASHTVEFDDIFKDGGYHPGSPTIAAALAVAQDINAPLAALHRAIIAGYEVGCRVSLAIQPSHYNFWHTTATVGTFGAAVAAAMLLEGDASAIAHAMALASSFASGHQQNLQGDGMAKALHPGHAADAGILAAMAACAGVTGALDSLHGPKGYAAATSDSAGNWQAALDGIGDWTPITRITVKNHGCCGHIFPALDGLNALQAQHGFAVNDIAAIHVRGYSATSNMCDRPQPRTAQEARFSLQYCTAALLLLGSVRLNAFTPEALEHKDLRELMALITVSEDPELTAAYPTQRMARISLTLTSGDTLQYLQTHRKGDPENPLSDAEIIAKFDGLAGSVLAPTTQQQLRHEILYGSALPGPVPLQP